MVKLNKVVSLCGDYRPHNAEDISNELLLKMPQSFFDAFDARTEIHDSYKSKVFNFQKMSF